MPKFPFLKRRGKVETDPVCKMQVPTGDPPGGTHEHGGKTYYFCAPGCRVAFSKEPGKYLSADWKGVSM